MAQCIVKGCRLERAPGSELCHPCFQYLTSGFGEDAQAFKNANPIGVEGAIGELAMAVRDGIGTVTRSLREIDETLALIANKSIAEESLPTASELFEKVSGLGAKAVLKAISDWEKKNDG